jgi:FAD:protein FMN transferase
MRHVERAMGTVFSFDIRLDGRAPRVTPALREALAEAEAWLRRVDAVFSTYRPDSAISRLARAETSLAACPPEVAEVLELCAAASERSGGWFSSTAGGDLDPSGLVKGWATERAALMTRRAGASGVCVNGGGDIQFRGEAAPGTPWQVGIADPLRPRELIAVVRGRDLAVATSGVAERGPHILDPHRREPATDLVSLTLVGGRLTQVDAYATAAFAMGPDARDWIDGLAGYEALAVTREGRVWQSAGFREYGMAAC